MGNHGTRSMRASKRSLATVLAVETIYSGKSRAIVRMAIREARRWIRGSALAERPPRSAHSTLNRYSCQDNKTDSTAYANSSFLPSHPTM